MDDDPKLIAIDPAGCGCTECLTGEYRPLQAASEDELRALVAGHLRDHTEVMWYLSELPFGGGFTVSAAGVPEFTVEHLPGALVLEHYRIELGKDTYEQLA